MRGRLEESYGKTTAACAIILYGGSVKPANSNPLFKEKNIDGFLVGGASLEAVSFIGIVREALRAYREEK
ncbi:MAG: triose-phosphate isomerase [Candidatus Moduliflexus flocculans]|nr:triose-phosphate isomerase [Candidatus Moduliflexus flocculans]